MTHQIVAHDDNANIDVIVVKGSLEYCEEWLETFKTQGAFASYCSNFRIEAI